MQLVLPPNCVNAASVPLYGKLVTSLLISTFGISIDIVISFTTLAKMCIHTWGGGVGGGGAVDAYQKLIIELLILLSIP